MSEPTDDALLASAQSGAEEAGGDNLFHVDLGAYEGPLHLLLDMARRQKVDLVQISILKLAEQYLAFVADARNKRVDLAADYLLMASWLAFLKSKLLLPSDKPDPEELSGEEMAGRLAFQLARLGAMRAASGELFEGYLDGRDVFRRGDPQKAKIVRTPIWTTNLHDLLKAFGDVNARKTRVKTHVVKRQPVVTLDGARRRLVVLAKELDEWQAVQTLSMPEEEQGDAPKRSVVASFFSAALELTKEGTLDLRQDVAFSDVFVRKADVRRASVEIGRPEGEQ